MNARLGGTSSPISIEKILSASAPLSIVTCSKILVVIADFGDMLVVNYKREIESDFVHFVKSFREVVGERLNAEIIAARPIRYSMEVMPPI